MPKPEPQPANHGHERLTVRDLDPAAATAFDLAPDSAQRAVLASEMDLSDLKKLRLHGTLAPEGTGDWRLTAHLGATVVQPCIATGVPVTTRIDTEVRRLFRASPDPEPLGGETEFDGDDESEPLGLQIDLGQVMRESLALALPDYPRAADAPSMDTSIMPPGVAPITDDTVKPFASLAALRDKMKD